MKALLVEDKKQLSDAIRDYLKMHKVECTCRLDGLEGYKEALTGIYDVIVLDLMLPYKDGLDIIKDLRAHSIDTPILVLTAKSSTEDKVKCLIAGADDYVTKPFVLEELLARLFAMARRKSQFVPNVLEFGDLKLDKLNHLLIKDEQKIVLSLKEYQILELFMNNSNQIISKKSIIEKVWGNSSEVFYNSAEAYISFLRRKLEALKSSVHIKSLRNVGYKLVAGTIDEEE